MTFQTIPSCILVVDMIFTGFSLFLRDFGRDLRGFHKLLRAFQQLLRESNKRDFLNRKPLCSMKNTFLLI